ncbi:MAG: methylenetetrahydrofolate reductase [NAD(P)H] [Planctomycetes bacterium]|nr:methylenetetrahydrofolate reductase [NAD(P)H] [Planctomycetota bacterium]
MRILQLYDKPEPTISFEFFPPKSAEAEATLFTETVPSLQELGPSFISVTYGAGGGTRATTLRVVDRIRKQFGIEAMAHLTCVGSTRDMLAAVLDEAHSLGIENILALRGDPPKGATTFHMTEGGFGHANELVAFVKSQGRFGVGAACYPEGHVECSDKKLDWDRAAAKVDAGAEFLISQLFYDHRDFLEMEDYLRNNRKVTVPIVPGVLPFLTAEQIKRFTALCGAKLADGLKKKLEALAHDDEAVRRLGVEVCSDICRKLLDHGVPGIHFYCLNRVPSCREIVNNLGLAST